MLVYQSVLIFRFNNMSRIALEDRVTHDMVWRLNMFEALICLLSTSTNFKKQIIDQYNV